MVTVELMDDEFYYLCTKRGEFKKMARIKEKPRYLFFVSSGFSVRFLNGKRKIYKYGKIQLGNIVVRLPQKFIGKHVRFKVEFQNDIGEWE